MEPVRNRRPVMDIKPRAVTRPAPRSSVAPASSPARPLTTNAPPKPNEETQPPQTINEPRHEVSAVEPKPVKSTTSEATIPPKIKAPIMAIIAALIVSGGLIGLSIFAFLRSNDKSTTQTSESSQAVTPEEVDTTTQSIDKEIDELDDATDFDANSISDDTLGL